MTMAAAVAGASGYAGGELLRLLVGHPDLRPTVVAAGQQAGRTVGEVHPALTPLADQVLVPTEPRTLATADVVFLALPHGESGALVAHLPPGLPVVDLGADFRLADPEAWRTYYGDGHAGTWVYGLPELGDHRQHIAAASRVANPGCFPTAVTLGAAPLLAAGLVEPGDVVVVAASGTSGAGRSPTTALLGTEVMGSASAYRVGGVHQHTPEIEQALSEAAGEPVSVSFTPVLAPMARGILATVTARLAAGVDGEALREALHAAYAHEPFVHLLPEGRWPRTADVSGSNAAQLQVAADRHAGRAVVVVAIDNLGKGAAGQAVQNANLVLGLPEAAGLSDLGVAP
ncbi:MAG: N-acetyl-gamma-glutamyl-phosphate reductase [Actinomycetota bacterium]|nr:N-acetyl-gamma-glutamyl-phosphate reductase [Actinomycetota bacterium]MDH4352600.1 N-acetyl-gamma-glutamyl-phosphate reductase [Actinomycetota bacterium]